MFARLCEYVCALSGWRARLFVMLMGAVSVLALPPFSFVPVLPVSLIVLMWRLDGTRNHWKSAALEGWCFGFGSFAAGLYWIGYSFLVDAAAFAWALPFAATLMPSLLAVFSAVAAVAYRAIRPSGFARLFWFAFCFGLAEWLRGHIFTGFPWNLTGYVWSDNDAIAQTVAVIGIYGLTAVTIAWAAALALLADDGILRHRKIGLIVAFVLLPVAAFVWGQARLETHDTVYSRDSVVRLVQPNIPQADKWKPENRAFVFQQLLSLTQSAGYGGISHVIWPESATPFLLGRDLLAQQKIIDILGPRTLLTGYPRLEAISEASRRVFNSVAQIDAQNGLQNVYDKIHLVPFGEYMPFKSILQSVGLEKLTSGKLDYSPGTGPAQFMTKGIGRIRPLICYEIIFPDEIPAGVSERPDLLLNQTNDAWFGDSTGPHQHLAMTKMRAIEFGLPVVRVANTGISAAFDPYGREMMRLGLNQQGILDIKIPDPGHMTFFARFPQGGGVFFWLFSGLALAIGVFGKIIRR